jgi:hypothetical protein
MPAMTPRKLTEPTAVKMRMRFPLFVHWVDRHPTPDGEAIIVVEHVMTPLRRWQHMLKVGAVSKEGWCVKTVMNFLAVSHRVSI